MDAFDICDPLAMGFDNTKNDSAPGERFSTSYAVTEMTWQGAVDAGIVSGAFANATPEQCATIRHVQFWNAMRCDLLSTPCALMVYHCGIGCGPGTAVRLAQRVAGVFADGRMGPITALAIKGMGDVPFVNAMQAGDDAYFASLAKASLYLNGWRHGEQVVHDDAIQLADAAAAASFVATGAEMRVAQETV